jgi:hypothetical protein
MGICRLSDSELLSFRVFLITVLLSLMLEHIFTLCVNVTISTLHVSVQHITMHSLDSKMWEAVRDGVCGCDERCKEYL